MITGFIELKGGSLELGNSVFEGNIFVDNEAICDDQWGHEEAGVVCRWAIFSLLLFEVGCKSRASESLFGPGQLGPSIGSDKDNCQFLDTQVSPAPTHVSW